MALYALYTWERGQFYRQGNLSKNYQATCNKLKRKNKSGYVQEINTKKIMYWQRRSGFH